MKSIKKYSVFAICFLVLFATSLMFAACGNTNSNKIRLNEVTHSIFYAPLYAAYNLGYFSDEGLEVTIESATGSDASMTALISGSADIVLIGPEQVVYADGLKDQPKVFGQLTQRDGSFFVSRDDITDFNLDMLKGKTIIGGRAGGLPAMTLEYIIKNEGLTIGTNSANNEVNLRTDVSFPMIGSEFITSKAEFCTLFEPTATNIEKEGNGHVLTAVGQLSGEIPYTCFTATESYLKKNASQAEKFLKAVYNGYKYIATNTANNAAKALTKSFPSMTIEELEIAVKQYLAIDAWSSDFILKEESYNRLLDIINTTQGAKMGVTYKTAYAKAVDNSIANLLAK